MRTILICLFTGMLLAMLVVTVWATLDRGMFDAGKELMEFPWFVATLTDTYFAFLAFYAWLAWRESTWPARGIWLVLVLFLGSMAIASYMLMQLYRRRGQPWDSIWQRG